MMKSRGTIIGDNIMIMAYYNDNIVNHHKIINDLKGQAIAFVNDTTA